MLVTTLAFLAVTSGTLMLWQWVAGTRFPLNARQPPPSTCPSISVLKPVKGADPGTAEALATWLRQDYPGQVEVLFGTESLDDPAVPVLRELLGRYPDRGARYVHCPERVGFNRKVSNLVQLAREARGEIVVVSDADVAAAPDLLSQLVIPFQEAKVGIVHCLYRLADAATPAARWEAFVVNADFWSQVLQNRSLKPLDYALGAVMSLRRRDLEAVGGFSSLANHLADDHHLGRLIVGLGRRTELCPIIVDCRTPPADWGSVWRHQLRWAITIRTCQPWPYFLSILANGTWWPALWMMVHRSPIALVTGTSLVAFRVLQGLSLEARFTGRPRRWMDAAWVLLKDILQVAVWSAAHLRREVVWRGARFRVYRDGRLRPVQT